MSYPKGHILYNITACCRISIR